MYQISLAARTFEGPVPSVVATQACTPRADQCRYVRGLSPDSFLPLAASGSTYTFTPAKYTVEDGRRYGVEVRIVRTADGLQGPPIFGDFIKKV